MSKGRRGKAASGRKKQSNYDYRSQRPLSNWEIAEREQAEAVQEMEKMERETARSRKPSADTIIPKETEQDAEQNRILYRAYMDATHEAARREEEEKAKGITDEGEYEEPPMVKIKNVQGLKPIAKSLSTWRGRMKVFYRCPYCGTGFMIYETRERYCHNCGTRIAWRGISQEIEKPVESDDISAEVAAIEELNRQQLGMTAKEYIQSIGGLEDDDMTEEVVDKYPLEKPSPFGRTMTRI